MLARAGLRNDLPLAHPDREKDLADALNAGEIAGAAVDVVTREPITADNPLLKAQNCIITPHIAWTTNARGERVLAPEGLYGRRKMTAYVRRTAVPDATAGAVDRAMRTLGLQGVRRAKKVRTTIPAKEAEVQAAPEGDGVMKAQELRDLRAARDDLERRVHDLKLTRQVTMQSLPSIRLVQENDKSLVTKINAQLGSLGKAAVNYTAGAESLKLQVNAGTTLQLVAGPADSDALARLGIDAGTLTLPAQNAKDSDATASDGAQTYGLGLTGTLDISTKMGADLARSQLLTVLSSLQSTYQKTNAPPPVQTVGNTSGTVSPRESSSSTACFATTAMPVRLMS